MYDVAKLCSNKPCESAFEKCLAKEKQQKKSIEAVTVHDVTEMDCIWAVAPTARIKLKAGWQYFKTAPVITSRAPLSSI